MAKTIDDLNKSRNKREEILQQLEGTIFESILVHNRNDVAIDLVVDRRRKEVLKETDERLERQMDNEENRSAQAEIELLKKEFDVDGQGSRGKGKSLSRFSQNVCRIVTKFYTKEGDIVLDPFAGHNSRFQSVHNTRRHYYGQDVCKEFMEDNFKIREMILKEDEKNIFGDPNKCVIDLTEGDSRKLPWSDNFGDFTITSPPYWFLEDYGPEPEQLGLGTYEEFLEGMQQVANENFRVLKPGAFCIWFINDFRVDGKMYSYHIDTLKLLEKAGFINHDMLIVDLGPSLRSVFLGAAYDIKVAPKRHEYGIVVRKPK